ETPDPTIRAEVARELVAALERRGAWKGLRALSRVLPEPEADDLRFLSSMALRRFDEVDRPRWAFMGRARSLGIRPVAGERAGDDLVWISYAAGEVVLMTPGGEVVAQHPLPDGDAVGALASGEGSAWWATRRHGVVEVYEVTRDRMRLAGRMEGGGAPLAAVLADPDGDGQSALYIGTGPPGRGLLGFDPASGTFFEPAPEAAATRSDVTELLALDTDRDGRDELVVLQSAWSAYDIQRLAGTDRELVTSARERLGGFSRGVVLPRPDGPLVALRKGDAYPNTELFDPQRRFGVAPGLYLLAPETDGWSLRHHLPTPFQAPTGLPVVSGDFDGDGWTDVAYFTGAQFGAMRVVLMGPDGVDSHAWITGLRPIASADADGDGDDELFVSLVDGGHELWMVGAGEGALPGADDPGELDDLLALPPDVLGAGHQLLELGLFAEAREAIAARAATTDEGDAAFVQWSAAARLAGFDGLGERADEALQHAFDLRPTDQAVRERLRALRVQRHVFDRRAGDEPVLADLPAVPPTELSFLGGVPAMQILAPHVVALETEGLRVRGVGADGVVARMPVDAVGPHLAVSAELDLISAELGTHLEVMLVDAAGRSVLGVAFAPYGGGRRLSRTVACVGMLSQGNNTDGSPVDDQRVTDEPFHLRASHFRGQTVCTVERGEGEAVDRHWTMDLEPPGPPVELQIRLWSVEGYEESLIDARVRSIRLEGAVAHDVPEGPGRRWILGDRRALEDFRGTALEPVLAAEAGDVGVVR
ncbi:MAG: hypothetical protein KC656_22545, partial [Myxococcales bacterium]|nr:hypothetical protein [Myxococcales bacterium]